MNVRAFLKELRTTTAKSVPETASLMKQLDSGVRSLDDTIRAMDVTTNTRGLKTIKGEPIGRLEKAFRSANIAELLRLAGRDVPFAAADLRNFEQLVAHLPDTAIKRIADTAESAARDRPGLKLTASQLDAAPAATKAEVTQIESRALKHFKTGAYIGLTIGAVTMTTGWIQKALRERQGCFMVTNFAGVITSCKVSAWSCVGSGGTFCNYNTDAHYNVTLTLMKAATLPNNDQFKIKLASAVGVAPSELNAKVRTIIDTKFQELSDAVRKAANNNTLPKMAFADYCTLVHNDVENGIIPPCRMCDAAADPTSTIYIDPAQISETTTMHCEADPQVLSLLSDLARNTTYDVFSSIGRGFNFLLRPIMYGVIALIVVCVIIASVLYVIRQNGRKKRAAEAAADAAEAFSDRTPLLPAYG